MTLHEFEYKTLYYDIMLNRTSSNSFSGDFTIKLGPM